MSDSSSDSDTVPENLPSTAECQRRVDEFVLVTGTNQALAQSFLQERSWSVEVSVRDYYIELDKQTDEPSTYVVTEVPPSRLTVLSWNIDGLDPKNLTKRIDSIVETILKGSPDVVLLQEVIPQTQALLERELPEYQFYASDTDGYYNATLIRVFTTYYDSHCVKPFTRTTMNRKQLITDFHIGKAKFVLLNTHLESTGDHASVRILQLQTCFKTMIESPEEVTVIFGGDLNLRDREVGMAGGLPSGVDDVWEKTGQRQEAKYTWDLKINTNLQMDCRFQPRMRFDRLYIRYDEKKRVKPVHFGFVGIDKVPGTQSYPSDHWGIQACFTITDN